MEEIIKKFDEVVGNFNQEFTSTESLKEQEAISKKYEKLISEAELEMEASIEEFIKKEDEILLQQQLGSEKELSALEEIVEVEEELSKIDIEIQFLKDNADKPTFIADRYYKTKNTKNGFSTAEIYKYLGGVGNPIEIKMAEYIYEAIM